MSERVHLALWWKAQPLQEILPRLGGAIACVPPAVQEAGARRVSVLALNWNEPPLLDETDVAGFAVSEGLERAREFVHEDCAVEVELAWPLWVREPAGWREKRQPLIFTSLGVGFADGAWREEGHLRVELGRDETYLLGEPGGEDPARGHVQSNILKVFGLVQRLETQLRPERRALASENLTDWTPQLLESLQNAYANGHHAPPAM